MVEKPVAWINDLKAADETIKELLTAKNRIKELEQETKDWNFCQSELEKQYLRVEKLESVLKECIDDPHFKIWFTDKYNRFKPLLTKGKHG